MWLTDKELYELTRKKQAGAQCRVLREAGIAYKLVDGRPVVPRDQFQQNTLPPEPRLRLA